MATTVHTLPDDVDALKEIIIQLQGKVCFLEEQFLLARQKRFGLSSESAPGQGELFNESEVEADGVEPEADTAAQTITYTRKKPGRKPLPKDLPREFIVHDIPEDEKSCACCAGPLHTIGVERSEQLDYIPATLKVIEHQRPKYSCRQCEKEHTRVEIKIAPLPPSPIPKSIATPSLLSQIIVHKYQFGLPLYRQETLFKQYGIELNRKTLANWMMACSHLLEPLIQTLKNELLKQSVIHADETPLKVIHDDKQKSYMWLYCAGTDSPSDHDRKNIVLYDYQPSRAGRCPVDYLRGYQGYLQVDGYAGYEQTQATLVGCMAHARRKFIDAQKAQPKGKTGKADWAVNHIQKLYGIEKSLKDKTPAERHAVRQEKSKPLVEELKRWLDKSAEQVPPKTLIGNAISYCRNQWPKLQRFLENGELAIDNNRAERAIKPFVIGRKNWLFSNTSKGAKASANLYSLIETAKANGLDPVRYLNHLLTEIPKQQKQNGVDTNTLLPWVFNA